MSPRFHVNCLSLVLLVCTLVCAQEPTFKQNCEEIKTQIRDIEGPVEEFVEEGIPDVAQIKGFDGYCHSCHCINTEENANQQCPAVTSCIDHVFSMTRYLSHFYDLIDEFLTSSREEIIDFAEVKRNLMNLKANILNVMLEGITHFQSGSSWQNVSCGANLVNYTTPEADSSRLEVTCTEENNCNLESKLGIGLLDWLSEMHASTSTLANVTDGDLQTLLDTCNVTSRTARSNKKEKKGKGGKGKSNQGLSKKELKMLDRQEKKKAKKAERIANKKAAKKARKAAAKAARKAEKKNR